MSSEIYSLYDQSLEYLTRLSAYAAWNSNCLGGFIEEDIDHMAITLMRRDLLILAATARNFTEYTKSVNFMKSIRFKSSILKQSLGEDMLEDGAHLNLYQALSRVLHSKNTGIIFGINPLMHICSNDEYTNYLITAEFRNRYYNEGVMISVRSEKSKNTYFYLGRLLRNLAMFLHMVVEDQGVRGTIMDRGIRYM